MFCNTSSPIPIPSFVCLKKHQYLFAWSRKGDYRNNSIEGQNSSTLSSSNHHFLHSRRHQSWGWWVCICDCCQRNPSPVVCLWEELWQKIAALISTRITKADFGMTASSISCNISRIPYDAWKSFTAITQKRRGLFIAIYQASMNSSGGLLWSRGALCTYSSQSCALALFIQKRSLRDPYVGKILGKYYVSLWEKVAKILHISCVCCQKILDRILRSCDSASGIYEAKRWHSCLRYRYFKAAGALHSSRHLSRYE